MMAGVTVLRVQMVFKAQECTLKERARFQRVYEIIAVLIRARYI
jgi:hypothetical protein